MTVRAKQASNPKIEVGLLWHSVNSANLGVGALTASNIALARDAARSAGLEIAFTIMGFVDLGAPAYIEGADVSVLALNGRTIRPGGAYWRKLGQMDAILDIGAGDSFADIYGRKRFAYLWLTKAMAIVRRTPLVLSPQTIGPFDRQPETFLAAWAMARAEAIVARDPISSQVAQRMAPKVRVIEAVDVAFALPFERRPHPADGRIHVGINVSGLLFNGGYSGNNEFGMQVDYADYSRRLIRALLDRPRTCVHLVCHVNTDDIPQDDDRRVADRLAAEFPGVVRVPDFASPSAAKSYISGLDFLVAGRMHACIAAHSSGVPVVPIAYSRKFVGLFEGVLGYRHVLPVTGVDTSGAIRFTLERLDRRAELVADIAAGSKIVEARTAAYCAELARVFTVVASRT